jgi:Ni/Fe-hydrogenase subunit HybB-like protein
MSNGNAIRSDALDSKLLSSGMIYKVLKLLMIIGFIALLVRMIWGLGVTNMNDGFPWGIWVAFDVVVGTALGCGGFLMAIVIYIFNKWHYHSLIRSAIVTSAFGYTIAGISVLIDLGRYWNSYTFFMPWRFNTNSILLEVALCIISYTLILWIEFMPILIEKASELKFMQKKPFKSLVEFSLKNHKLWNKILVGVIALGILLPIMHQSSLGSLMVIAGYKVHPFWQTGFLPLLFIISVVFMGYSVVIVESYAASYLTGRPFETNILKKIMPIIVTFAAVWIFLRVSTIYYTGAYHLLWTEGMYSILLIFELLITLIAIILMLGRETEQNAKKIFISAFLLLIVGSVYRFNVYVFAFDPMDGHTYFPSVVETLVTLGFFCAEILLYLIFIRNLPILPANHKKV